MPSAAGEGTRSFHSLISSLPALPAAFPAFIPHPVTSPPSCMPDESAQASMGRSWNRAALFATGGALLLMVLALVNYSTAPLPPPRKLSLEAYTAFLSDYIQEFRKLLLVLARKAAELEQRGVDARKAAASLEAEHRSLGNALNERLLLKHRTSAHISG